MRGKIENFKIISMRSAGCSVYGNPAMYVLVKRENGEIVEGRTGSNCAIGYGIQNHKVGETVKIEYHYSKKGNLIFTREY